MDSKKNKRRNNKDSQVNKEKYCLEQYMNINHTNLTTDDLEKIKNYYSNRRELATKLYEENNLDELFDLSSAICKKNVKYGSDSFEIENKHKLLEMELNKLKEVNCEYNKKLNDKEKYSKMLIDKINNTNDDKNNFINECSEKRNNLVKETENFVRSLQTKYEEELPEKKKLIEENQNLREEIEKCIQNSSKLKDVLELQLKEKEKISENMENKIKNEMKCKMQNMSYDAQKYIFENSELKLQIINYKKKNEEMLNIVNSFSQEFEKLRKEIEKVRLII
jgi:hypothetical protein